MILLLHHIKTSIVFQENPEIKVYIMLNSAIALALKEILIPVWIISSLLSLFLVAPESKRFSMFLQVK